MAANREQLDALFTRILDLEDQKKALGADVKAALESFVTEHSGETPKQYNKAVKKAFKNFKELQKDRAEFILVESETDNMTEALLSVTGE